MGDTGVGGWLATAEEHESRSRGTKQVGTLGRRVCGYRAQKRSSTAVVVRRRALMSQMQIDTRGLRGERAMRLLSLPYRYGTGMTNKRYRYGTMVPRYGMER